MTLRRHGLSVVASVTTLSALAAAVEGARPPELVVLGDVPDATAATAVRRLHAAGVAVIVLTSRVATENVVELCSAGALAVIGRGAADDEMSDAVNAALAGERYLPPTLLSAMFDPRQRVARQPRFDLTVREKEILVELASGLSNDEIGERLRIGSQTVKTHLGNIYDKLGVRRRSLAVRLAVTHGLV